MVVKLTQAQADYLKTFREPNEAIYYISRWGWCHALKDGNEKIYGAAEKEPFRQDEKLKMLLAVINGYEVSTPEFKFYNFSNKSGVTPLYYVGKNMELISDVSYALKVKKNSKEYEALERLGFYKEEV